MSLTQRLKDLLFQRPEQPEDPDTEGEQTTVSDYPYLLVPEPVTTSTIRGLQSHSPAHEDHEGVVYWAGVNLGDLDAKLVTTCIVPEAVTTPGSFTVPAGSEAQVVQAIHDHNLQGIGHVHSHPGSWAGHSPGDDEGAGLVFDGYYSIVVPNYGHSGMCPMTQCGIHCYWDGQFHQLDDSQIEQQISVIASPMDYLDLRTV